jgi:hypothetical protein
MIRIPEPELQVSFALALTEIRSSMLQDALKATIKTLDIPTIDRQLAEYVPAHSLAVMAGQGLRGELMFATPCVIEANPHLVGYYRLLYGFSQKEFHKTSIGGQFRSAELSGALSRKSQLLLPEFCRAMAEAGTFLLAGISSGDVSAALLDDLSLLTLGPQLRGGANVRVGEAAIIAVFGVIKSIVEAHIVVESPRRMELRNAAGSVVLIEFSADPDIIIREEMGVNDYRLIIAIEVKGGRDFSNIHNRIGEAEKSHQKARAAGYTECWTVVNVDAIDRIMAARESPSTNRFYRISDLTAADGAEFMDFRNRIVSLTGIPRSKT